ncbi:cation-translocating P-type ATPase [Chlorobaculum sp. MV4-Y]|uniref:cation-translocating P-type ATPase n=1 Tax=Chlorobaculum sp. MV4-Y TaxID=2976335 RepID=UPI0021AE7680|nr:cation-translocating P-type ATPase [Chlorobaculum sp. MV4-Y]UWX58664.1 cation-translocating P-type ATPase [Chlorobaculum sp. MV4-Y]
MDAELNGMPSGLSAAEVRVRLERDGWNELPSSKKRSWVAMLIDVVREPMFLMLIACGLIYLLLGSMEDALMLLGFVVVMIFIAVVQENRTERALETLRDLTSPRALVIRDGRQQRIAGREVVRDDIILLAEGDRVPADAVLLFSSGLSTDESLLTGESFAVSKAARPEESGVMTPEEEERSFVYSGTLVVKGRGMARVLETGLRTRIGMIGAALHGLEPEEGLLQKQMRRIVRTISIYSVALCIIVAVAYSLTRHDWLNGILAGLTLAMATLPEEFPMVLLIFLAIGAWRISRHNVLTRRLTAIETLGAATVLCVDKTGTLTENRMSVRKIHAGGGFYDLDGRAAGLPEAVHETVEYSILASPPDPFDPMEKAMRELGERVLANTEHLHRDWELLKEYPLSEHLLAMSHVWRSKTGNQMVIAAKGAPEAIFDLCHFDSEQLAALQAAVEQLASDGMRVIGVAKALFGKNPLPEEQHDYDFTFVGLLGLEDPVRAGVPEALKECRDAGMRMIMITGDYPATARRIGEEIGLPETEHLISGPELESMDERQLDDRIASTSTFARVQPGQKLRIVQALKKRNDVVAMTGDGVNDAPALKAAHIGIAMGARGTDVAREAASLVLVDDHFDSIVRAVRMGRRIYDNLQKAMAFILSVHLPIAGMSLIPALLDWPLALLPAHILFLELIIDPSCSIVFEMECEEAGIMTRPPRRLDEALLGRKVLVRSLVQGLSIFLAVLAVYALMTLNGYGEGESRMIAFAGIVIGNLGLIFSNRSWNESMFRSMKTPNKALWWVTSGTLFFLGIVIGVPFVRELFRFATPEWRQLPSALFLSMVCFILPDIVKRPFFRALFQG